MKVPIESKKVKILAIIRGHARRDFNSNIDLEAKIFWIFCELEFMVVV